MKKSTRLKVVAAILWLIGGFPALRVRGATSQPASEPKVGSFSIDCPVDARVWNELEKRQLAGVHFKPVAQIPNKGRDNAHPEDFTSKSHFAAYVPEAYKSDGTWGLILYANPFDNQPVTADWRKICDDRHFVIVTPQDAGNAHHDTWRMAQFITAEHEMSAGRKLNKSRIYIVGTSGGGRMASTTATLCPEFFAGAICNCGVDVPMVDGKKPAISSFDAQPNLVKTAMSHVRFYLYTGSKDINGPETKDACAYMQKLGFRDVAFFEQPGAAHGEMSDENLLKGLAYLDAPHIAAAAEKLKQAELSMKSEPLGRSMLLYRQAGNLSYGSDPSAKAEAALVPLIATYQQELAAVQAIVDAGDRAKASAAIAAFSMKYGPWAKDDVSALKRSLEHPGARK